MICKCVTFCCRYNADTGKLDLHLLKCGVPQTDALVCNLSQLIAKLK